MPMRSFSAAPAAALLVLALAGTVYAQPAPTTLEALRAENERLKAELQRYQQGYAQLGQANPQLQAERDPTTGQGIVAFVILRESGVDSGDELVQTLRNHVARDIGPIAKPRQIMVVQELPKTRSGKIMRRLLRDIAENRELGDVTTLTDSSVMNLIKEKLPAAPSED